MKFEVENLPGWEFNSVQEQDRRYFFPDGEVVKITDVTATAFRDDKNYHRLECIDGTKWIISNDWLAIEIIGVDAWSY